MNAAEAKDSTFDEDIAMQAVDPSWFESPVERISTSGGTAPFFKLVLTEKGLEHCNSGGNHGNIKVDKNFWIGKDLSHAADEKDFYFKVLRIRQSKNESDQRDLTEGIGLLEPYMFKYLGVLKTMTSENEHSNLLVMRNLRNNFNTFRMLDIKIGEKTAQAGWKGKSRLRAMKHHVMDGLSNSAMEGYRLAGFNGCPEVFDSIDPLADIIAKESDATNCSDMSIRTQPTTMWGMEIDKSKSAQAHRFWLNCMSGTSMIRFFLDLHMDGVTSLSGEPNDMEYYTPIEVSEIVSHELMAQLIELASLCHKVRIPQKWIGSSVAVVYDSGFFPNRLADGDHEADIRSKVICKAFDWGRSELLRVDEFEKLTPEEKNDRRKFWELYMHGLDRLSYNAARFYYNQFTRSSNWHEVTIEVMDFDSMSQDDYIGKVVVPLPDPSDTTAIEKLKTIKPYVLKGSLASTLKKCTVSFSITWVDFPIRSRLRGAWRVTIERATNLPPLDLDMTSDPYCVVNANHKEATGQHFRQRTCIKPKDLNPEWNESFDIPVCRSTNNPSLNSVLQANGISPINDEDTSKHFHWDKTFVFKDRDFSKWWSNQLSDTNA